MVGRPKVREDRRDQEAIISTALQIARRQVADLTMRAVSDELRVSVGALYKHVAGRDELIALVVEKVLSLAPRISDVVADGWLALRAQVMAIQDLVDTYPGLDRVIIAHSPNSPKANEIRREGIKALKNDGLTMEEARCVYRTVTYLWLGSRVATQGRSRNEADIDTFAVALDILLAGLKSQITDSQQRRSVHDLSQIDCVSG